RQQAVALSRANRETGKIVIAVAVHARHFSGFTADQRRTGLTASFGNARNDVHALVRRKLAGRKIIEEEKWLGTLNNEIVDAHGNQIDAHRVVLVGVDGDLQLGADAVIGGNEHRVLEACGLEVEQAAKAADLSVRTGAARGPHERLDLLDHKVAGIDVDASLRIGQAIMGSRLVGGLIGGLVFHGHGLLLKWALIHAVV